MFLYVHTREITHVKVDDFMIQRTAKEVLIGNSGKYETLPLAWDQWPYEVGKLAGVFESMGVDITSMPTIVVKPGVLCKLLYEGTVHPFYLKEFITNNGAVELRCSFEYDGEFIVVRCMDSKRFERLFGKLTKPVFKNHKRGVERERVLVIP